MVLGTFLHALRVKSNQGVVAEEGESVFCRDVMAERFMLS